MPARLKTKNTNLSWASLELVQFYLNGRNFEEDKK